MTIWSSISSKKFFQSLLDLLRTKDIPEVQMKLLGLIQKWGINFEDKKSELPNFYSVYSKLRNSNVQFPNNFESGYLIYISDRRNNYKNRDDNRNDEYENENNDKDDKDGETFYYMESLKNILKVPNFEHKYRRLVNFLVKMHDNIQMANLLIDSRERSGLKDIINTLREGNNTLIDTISGGRLKDEKLMEITLGTTEHINQTLSRDEDVKNGYKPKKFTSYFVLNNVIPIKNNNNYRSRAKSTKPKKSIQRREEYDIDSNRYDRNKYKEKISGRPKNIDDIFDLFPSSTLSNEPGNNQKQNNLPINNNFFPQNQIRGNYNYNQIPILTNNPLNNISSNNNGSNNNNFQGNNTNNSNNFRNGLNQNKNQQMPVMTNFDILEQKLKNINMEQNNFNSQSTQFNPGFNNNNMNNNLRYTNNNNSNGNSDNLMSMLDKLGPSPQSNSNQLTPYIGGFNQNNNYNNNNNNQFNNFNNNMNNNQINNNFNNNGNINNNFNNNQNYNFNNNNQSNNFSNSGNNFNNNNLNNIQFNNMNNNKNNNFLNNSNNNNNGNMFNFGNNNNNQMGMSQNINNNFGMGQNNNQQMSLEEMEKQRKLKELDDLF